MTDDELWQANDKRRQLGQSVRVLPTERGVLR